jgi:hypothetical protein
MSGRTESRNLAPSAHPGLESDGAAESPEVAWRQLTWITLGAIAIFVGLRLLPTGTNLSHMDFRVDPKAGNVIEFCDPLSPQFIRVVAARSPVTLSIATAGPAATGREIRAVVTLKTGSGKPVAPEDLIVTHTRRLHLLLVDPSLSDYQHVHPEPTGTPGQWAFTFTPRLAGAYRVFADFTPAATGRGLYASVDLDVAGAGQDSNLDARASGRRGTADQFTGLTHGLMERDGVAFSLSTIQQPARAGQPIDLRFAMRRSDGGEVSLQPVMGAFAHLVAFDEARSGFAHLHPAEADLLRQPDPKNPVLNFKLTIPRGGHYVVWAQVNIGGQETFVPFGLTVAD